MAKIGGDPQSAPVDVFTTTSNPQAAVGSRYVSPDGRVYRYAQFDLVNNLVAGNLLQGVTPVLNHQNNAVQTAAAVGATTVAVTLGATAATAGFYTNGVLIVNAGAGHLGWTYGIQTNTAGVLSGTCTITLTEPLQTALATSDKVCLVPNPYQGVVQNPTTTTGTPVGAAITPGTSAFYGYIQTRGLCAVLSDSLVAAKGQAIAPSTTTAGAVTLGTSTNFFEIGNSIVAGVSAETRPVFLTLE